MLNKVEGRHGRNKVPILPLNAIMPQHQTPIIHPRHLYRSTVLISLLALTLGVAAQPLTGVWRGKVKKNGFAGGTEQVELKLVRNGDSLVGMAYYYQNPSRFEQVPLKGYVDPWTGTVTFWDDPAHEVKGHRGGYSFETDFNCPGEGVQLLDGQAGASREPGKKDMTAHFQKVEDPIFEDGWDEVIRDYTSGANDPRYIDSVYNRMTEHVASAPVPVPDKNVHTGRPGSIVATPTPTPTPIPAPLARQETPLYKPSPQEMMDHRTKRLVAEIPLTGDSVLLSFYDNAEIDGDSISLFMNGRLLYEHVLLKASAFTVKIPVAAMDGSNELVMVAENLGSIPPNTSLMVAYVDGKRYEATLESTEGSSAMIRFYKPVKTD
jgi:hypothetical protein